MDYFRDKPNRDKIRVKPKLHNFTMKQQTLSTFTSMSGKTRKIAHSGNMTKKEIKSLRENDLIKSPVNQQIYFTCLMHFTGSLMLLT